MELVFFIFREALLASLNYFREYDVLLWQLNNATYAMNLCLFLI